ncbi:MAG: molybdopterin-guanine dinucleotide biosynthesis protein B [Hyphomicrobium sp.]|jgi:molybdopterin-guanine dinucleotide biosynthesis protein B|nr:molybdopterin-guanine dinucleotide biosynthesis protein B [Hyphomicrobium sp.]
MKPVYGPPVIGIAGWKNSGKTTLVVRLIEEFTRRGLRVASVKHSHHDVSVDVEDTDSAHHRRAGARDVVLVGPDRWALIHEGAEQDPAPSLENILPLLSAADLVIVEGFKSAHVPKIEARRSAQDEKRYLAPGDPHIVAIASDHATDHGTLPLFALDDVQALADFISRTVLSKPG